jgi:hypothetical protein
MMHLSDLSWTQFLLIEVGVLFQFVAICATVVDTSGYRQHAQPKSEGNDTDDHDWAAEISDRIEPDREPEPDPDEHPSIAMKAGDLTRTAKVPFVQTFNFRRHGA